MEGFQHVECGDFQLFQARLKLMRELDEKIIYTLNTKLPSDFVRADVDPKGTCKELYTELLSTYSGRDKVIKGCITVAADKVKELANIKEKDPSNPSLIKDLRKEQTKLRMLQSELGVEEVVKERSLKVFHERCRLYFKP